MKSKFNVNASFHNGNCEVCLNIGTVEAEDQSNAESMAANMNLGKLFYKKSSYFLFHETDNGISVVQGKDVSYCRIHKPVNNSIKQIEITFSELMKRAFDDCVENERFFIFFDDISFSVSSI